MKAVRPEAETSMVREAAASANLAPSCLRVDSFCVSSFGVCGDLAVEPQFQEASA